MEEFNIWIYRYLIFCIENNIVKMILLHMYLLLFKVMLVPAYGPLVAMYIHAT